MTLLHLSTDVLALCIVLVLLSYSIDARVFFYPSDWSFSIDKWGPYYSISFYKFELRLWKRVKEPEEEPICPCGDDRCQDKMLCMLTPA